MCVSLAVFRAWFTKTGVIEEKAKGFLRAISAVTAITGVHILIDGPQAFAGAEVVSLACLTIAFGAWVIANHYA
ncbi:hypothetical protein GCM10007159_06220 [Modicisalibacter luteus]|nr:hypothetical protein GCM10007159_06220 [Halomonas lutea]